MISDVLFHKDTTGKIRSWQYEVDGNKWRTIAGLVDGEKVVSNWTVSVAKSQETDEEQALFEAHAEFKKKLDRKYVSSLDDVDMKKAAGVMPMLAQKYEKFTVPVFSQGKLDGIRCLANKDGLWSRQNKPIVSVPHIVEALQPLFEKHPDAVLDGELYNHELKDDFNKIASIVRKTKPTDDDFNLAEELIQYHVYDLPSCDETFKNRNEELNSLISNIPFIVNVETKWHEDEESLDKAYEELISLGYEGQMIRFDAPYEQKRSKNLLKRKDFQDDEFEFICFEEGKGNWSGYAKSVKLRLKDGREFGAGIKGNQDFCKDLLDKVFKIVTVRYFALTPDGIPRFPVAVVFYEDDRF